MQTPKARTASKDLQQRSSVAAPRAGRKLKITAGSDSDSFASPNPISTNPKSRSLKGNDRQSPQSSASEAQLVELQEELKKAREQISSSESLKKKAQREVEDTKKQLAAMSEKLEESEKQLLEFSDSEEARLQELRKISQDRDRAWQSELEALQKQHELDSAALSSAMAEIQKLKAQLERVTGSELAAQARHGEIHHLRLELAETNELVDDLKAELNDSKESAAKARQELSEAQMQLEVARLTEETLRADVVKAESCKSMAFELELEQSKNQETESKDLKAEINELRSALESSERRYQEEYIQTTLQIRTAYELLEKAKSESSQRETHLQAKLKAAKSEIESLQKELSMGRESSKLEAELKNSEMALSELKACLLDKETELQCIAEENTFLKSEIQDRELSKNSNVLVSPPEQESSSTIDEQVRAAQAANLELQAELRRLKVQNNQWRKAVEAAAAMLSSSTGNNGKLMGSPLFDDINEDDSPKKKNGNMLKKIGVLLKKGQK
ncbi:PREDICTED: interactor of constitutive active ROPs 2, chloroplastic-like isoform X2 [Ipomoea nil]|uniref:interactor of constitutive active ROPs 2, chloroplastic-like isoform X2 n=1 Tax=Ipomoea nil TaxID=35883 RepID=UPI000900ABB1|nr:PREDICTED: interactor of constitutive active ROPs 2, chloroplastic-like isoform X2 [Ipomoea nil]